MLWEKNERKGLNKFLRCSLLCVPILEFNEESRKAWEVTGGGREEDGGKCRKDQGCEEGRR